MPKPPSARKTRNPNRKKETPAINAIRDYCERHNLIFQAEPREDFGVDCYIEVAHGEHPRNFIVGVQSKAGDSYARRELGTPQSCDFKIDLRAEDIDYWLAANYPIILIYRADTGEQYFKHVQADWEQGCGTHRQHLLFSEADRVGNSNLANYLRSLVDSTPSTASRLEVLRGSPKFEVEGQRRDIYPTESAVCDLQEVFRRCEDGDVGHQTSAQVLGYSADDRYVLEARFVPLGMTGFIMALLSIHNLHTLRIVNFEILRKSDFDNNKGVDSPPFRVPEVAKRLEEAKRSIERIRFYQPNVLYSAPPRTNVDQFDGPPLYLSFGTEGFEVRIESDGARQMVLLRNDRYRPPRTTKLLTERIDNISDPNLDVEFPIQTKPFVGVLEVAASPSGKILSFTVTTNAENLCWGNPDVHLLHFELDRIREECRVALL